MNVLVVLLHARFSVVGPIPFLLGAIFFPGHPYIGSTTVLPVIVYNYVVVEKLTMYTLQGVCSAHAFTCVT